MRIGALAPWFGAKRAMAPEIVRELGPHRAYDEPCCGSAAVLFGKPRSEFETINDLHGDLVNLAMCVASERCVELWGQVQRLLACEDTLRAFQTELAQDYEAVPTSPADVSDDNLRRAVQYLGLSWLARNGVSGSERVNYQVAVRWTQTGGSPAQRWQSVVDSIPDWHLRLRGVVILRRDLFDILPRLADERGRAIYVDPPYFKSTRGTGDGSRYLYDFDAQEHVRLAEELRRFRRARVVVSYYDDPRIAELYPAWTQRVIERPKNLALQNQRGAKKTMVREVLVINGPSLVECDQGRLW